MNEIEQMLRDRTTSGFELSIGTSLAMESAFNLRGEPYDPRRVLPIKVKLNTYNKHYVSLLGLVVNILYAADNKDRILRDIAAAVPDVVNTVTEEITYLIDLYNSPEAGNCELVVYDTEYAKIPGIKKLQGLRRLPTTDLQMVLDTFIQATLAEVRRRNVLQLLESQNNYNNKKNKTRRLITTSTSLDLLLYDNHKVFDLLEFHTGKLKSSLEFNTKYHPIGKLYLGKLPFQEKLLYMLGDKSFFKPMRLPIRREIYRLSEENKWSPISTVDKVSYYIKKNPDLYNIYNKLPKLF